MSFFSYRWDKCRVLAMGGTYVYLIEGGTNVGGTNVGGTNVGGRKVASSFGILLWDEGIHFFGFNWKDWVDIETKTEYESIAAAMRLIGINFGQTQTDYINQNSTSIGKLSNLT
jgi:hypothetical protein